jgi:hypothetical protein
MPSYIIDKHRFEVAHVYENPCEAAHDMSEFYGWIQHNRYQLFTTKSDAFEYWKTTINTMSDAEIISCKLFEMFDKWLES